MAEMAENGRKRVAAGKWQEMDFRVFYVVAIEVEKRRSGKNGKNGLKMGCRGYLVGNGFPRVLRHSPTTDTLKFESVIHLINSLQSITI